jgi:hypothetical protein
MASGLDPFTIVFVFAYSGFIIYAFYIFSQNKAKRKEREIRKKFIDTLYRGIKNNQISTYDDLIHIYEGISGLSSEEIKYRSGLNQDLKKIYVALVNCDSNVIEGIMAEDDTSQIKIKIDGFINQVTTVSPFAELPSPERTVLSDINNLTAGDDNSIVKQKILDLAGMIQTRHSSQKKCEETSRIMTPITILSVILTIIFGIMSLLK